MSEKLKFVAKNVVSINKTNDEIFLTVRDNGKGMSTNIISKYLLGIASDYWNSQDFFNEFPEVKKEGFKPTGKFGIGFLSVFMLGDQVEVETERKGGQRLTLKLKGLGRHGAMKTLLSTGNYGTTIKISLTKQDSGNFSNIESIIKAKAPMLSFPVSVSNFGTTVTIESGWWKKVSQQELLDFVDRWEVNSVGKDFPMEMRYRHFSHYRRYRDFDSLNQFEKWPGSQPEIIKEKYRVLAVPSRGKIVICSKGIAISAIYVDGIEGIVEIGEISLNAARNQALQWDSEAFRKKIVKEMKREIIKGLNGLFKEGMIQSRFEFIKDVVDLYGDDLLSETELPWINTMLPPGELKLFSSNQIRKYLDSKNEALIIYGTNPWKAEKVLKSYFPLADRDAVIFPVNNIGQPEFGSYRDDDKVIKGKLESHMGSYERAVLLMGLLKEIATAWNLEVDQLIQYTWLRNGTSCLCTHIKRGDFAQK